MYTEEQMKENMVRCGLKITRQRMAVYKALIRVNHPYVEDVIQEAHKEFPEMTIATVYNTLDTFVLNGLITKIKTITDKMRYDVNCNPHHHIYGLDHQTIQDYHDPELDTMLEGYFRKKKVEGWNIVDYRLQIRGKQL